MGACNTVNVCCLLFVVSSQHSQGSRPLRGWSQRNFKGLQQVTRLLQNAQRALYRFRHLELAPKEAKSRRAAATASWQRRKLKTSQTLFAAWNIPYQTPTFPRWKLQPNTSLPPLHQPARTQSSLSLSCRWTQFASSKFTPLAIPATSHRPPQTSTRNDHRRKLQKLRKLRNCLLICR
jgi:hypothetical protein